MSIIKNAIVYRVTLPTASQMRQHLEDEPGFLHTPITDSDFRSDGFVVNSTTGDLVADFGDGQVFNFATWDSEEATGGYVLTLRSDEKIIPNSAVDELYAQRLAEHAEKHGAPAEKEQAAVLKEQVSHELCGQAFSRTHFTTALYHQASGLLFVNTTTPGKAHRLLNLLVRMAGSVKSETIHINGIKKGLTTRLENLIEGEVEAPFGGMQADDQVKLKRKLAQKDPMEKIAYTGTDIDSNNELLGQLHAGFEVEELGLWHPTGVHFRLTHQFRFRGIETTDIEPDDDADGAHLYRLQATNDASCLVAVVHELCDLLGYEPPAEDEESEATTEGASND